MGLDAVSLIEVANSDQPAPLATWDPDGHELIFFNYGQLPAAGVPGLVRAYDPVVVAEVLTNHQPLLIRL